MKRGIALKNPQNICGPHFYVVVITPNREGYE